MLLVLGRRQEGFFLPVYCKQHPVRTVGSDCAHLNFCEPQDLSCPHQVTSDMTRIHITSSTRVKGGVGWRTFVPAEFKGGKQSRTRVTDAKVANKNEPTSLAGAKKIKTQRQTAIC